MKTSCLLSFCVFVFSLVHGGSVEKVYYFDPCVIRSKGIYQSVTFDQTKLSGIPGEPELPYRAVFLMLPPGEAAVSIEFLNEDEVVVGEPIDLFPRQHVRPVSSTAADEFVKNEQLYQQDASYPSIQDGKLTTQHLNGFGYALSTFTPVKYNPAGKRLSYYRKVTVRIITAPEEKSLQALKNLPASSAIRERAIAVAQNPEMALAYPFPAPTKTAYDILIITPQTFQNEFQALTTMYANRGLISQVSTVESINTGSSGWDLKEKIRNHILGEYQDHFISFVILAGNPAHVPYRGFYCAVQSDYLYTDSNIPADLYYSGLDGTYDDNGNHVYGEIADNPDLLPDISVGRFPFSTLSELQKIIHKSVSYQTNPVLGELTNPLMLGEYLYNPPLTFGGPYMDLLIDNHSDNGYFTYGIPSAENNIEKLYDTLISLPLNIWQWNKTLLISKLNQGKSFIHHLGHSSSGYMLRMYVSDITNLNFSKVDGIRHNYQILYTQGCYCGSFDVTGFIAGKALIIDNFLVSGVFNSRYGWFNQGTTDGPSEHLQREFTSALYHPITPEHHLGTAHLISKVMTAPWIGLPGEFEPGAQRWVHYCSNVLGDPVLEIWTKEPTSFTTITWTGAIDNDWNKPGNWNPAMVPSSLSNVIIPNISILPDIPSSTPVSCHDLTIQDGCNFIVGSGKTLIIRGDLRLSE
ncbi:MAG: hypothetical protein FJY10_08540 [Bacteroidetes bacterium]|nr:hypothetical protein [Bacteroidota bacterium]